MDAVERKRNCDIADGMDTSETSSGKRNRAIAGAVDTSEDMAMTREKRHRASDLHSALGLGKKIAKECAQLRDPQKKARRAVKYASPADGVDAATPVWTAQERRRVSGQEVSEDKKKLHGGFVSAAKAGELRA